MRKLRRAHKRQARKAEKLKQRALAAGTAAVIVFGAGMAANHARAAYSQDHLLPVAQDTDADLLTNAEELAIGYLPFDPDQNGNQIPDGVDLAKSCAAITNQLTFGPHPTDPDKPYIEHAGQFGLETCDICGQTVNMGPASIVNPKLGLTVECPLIAMHYMEHGSFSYAGDVHNGRLDVPALLQALDLPVPDERPNHQLPVDNDADGDLLTNTEELAIGYLPFDPDQNRNQTPDGVELAKRCAAVTDGLPTWDHQGEPPKAETYKVHWPCQGTELCEICGEEVNMCHVEIVNPQLGLSIEVKYIALHYMEHGSFSYDGTENDGRVNVALLMRVLELRFPNEPDEHQLPLDYVADPVGRLAPDANDLDSDLLADSEELGTGLNLYDADQDDDLSPDGIELAEHCKVALDSLPQYDSNNPPLLGIQRPYKFLHRTRGLETCEICGLTIPMNYWEVVNPRRGYLTIDVLPVMAAHYMEHGSFSYAATVHKGRVDIPLLLQILEMPRRCGHLGTMYLPGDLNKDCKVDFKDFAQFADKWLQSTQPN